MLALLCCVYLPSLEFPWKNVWALCDAKLKLSVSWWSLMYFSIQGQWNQSRNKDWSTENQSSPSDVPASLSRTPVAAQGGDLGIRSRQSASRESKLKSAHSNSSVLCREFPLKYHRASANLDPRKSFQKQTWSRRKLAATKEFRVSQYA